MRATLPFIIAVLGLAACSGYPNHSFPFTLTKRRAIELAVAELANRGIAAQASWEVKVTQALETPEIGRDLPQMYHVVDVYDSRASGARLLYKIVIQSQTGRIDEFIYWQRDRA